MDHVAHMIQSLDVSEANNRIVKLSINQLIVNLQLFHDESQLFFINSNISNIISFFFYIECFFKIYNFIVYKSLFSHVDIIYYLRIIEKRFSFIFI